MLHRPHVAAFIEAERAASIERTRIDVDRVKREFARIAFGYRRHRRMGRGRLRAEAERRDLARRSRRDRAVEGEAGQERPEGDGQAAFEAARARQPGAASRSLPQEANSSRSITRRETRRE